MQRRLVSSIAAIKNTLERRWKALQSIAEETSKNPNLWSQRHRLDSFDVDTIEDFEELDDNERDALEGILADPKKFKLFTTAGSPSAIKQEADEVKQLFEMAKTLYQNQQAEKKFQKLKELLKDKGVFDKDEKLVIFTEHKDTLNYLEERLTRSEGYRVATIHGGKTVDERREAQWLFAKPETQILIATDAAGEGINLQFCRLLINWDIPWNPNRLEQRMGRIHRYGQKQDVLVFNMVANNTREGRVLVRLLEKLDNIRTSIGDDRVYDVIQDVMENVGLDAIINSVFNGKQTAFDDFLAQDEEQLKAKFAEKIKTQKEKLAHSTIDYKEARLLKENSDEKRLQPIYVKMFFERAFAHIGGQVHQLNDHIFKIKKMPEAMNKVFKEELNKTYLLEDSYFCFDKDTFLKKQPSGIYKYFYYLNPGSQLFDVLIKVIRNQYREDMLKGTILISPIDKEDYLAFFVKSQIMDERTRKKEESIVDEQLLMVCQNKNGEFTLTSPAKFIDLHAPSAFAKTIEPPTQISHEQVISWSFEQITARQFEDTQQNVAKDIEERKRYLEEAFTDVIISLQAEIQAMQGKLLLGDTRVQEKIPKIQEKINELIHKKKNRLTNLELMKQLSPKTPEIVGCAYVVPLTQVEYSGHYGMSRDDQAEAIAMKTAIDYEISVGWLPTDVAANNEGYDIRSINTQQIKRYIEVKGRSGSDGSVMLTENEKNRLEQLGEAAWLYIVTDCKTKPQLFRIQNPTKNLSFELRSKGIQYFLTAEEWKHKTTK